MAVYFQIGTNDGNDLFNSLVKSVKPKLVILVEPNIALVQEIKRNYKDVENVHIFNNAIYYHSDMEVELYIPACNGVYGTKADNGFTYTHCHFSLLPMNDWASKDDMCKIKAKTITFDDICEEFGIKTIDYLQIDAEGFDSEILKMIDLDKFNIKKIRFENWGFDEHCFMRHHENWKELGKVGVSKAIQKLTKYNYKISSINDTDGNDILAVKC